MTSPPSIYDLTIESLRTRDFSRPLFVQACRSPQFTGLLDTFHRRLGLSPERSAILTNVAYPGQPWWPGRHIVNPDARLSSATAGYVSTSAPEPFSIVVTITTASIADYFLAMRDHSNIACFCHAMEPVPSLVVNTMGQFATARDFFEIRDHVVGGVRFVGNMLVSQAEAEALARAAINRPRGHIVEVGRFSGGTAILLALAGRQGGRPGVVSIDCERFPAAEHFLRVNGVDGDVQLLDGDSQLLARRWPSLHEDSGISMLFIDADHSYDAVTRDLASWVPHVVDGGTIALHDASWPEAGVAKAAYELLMDRDDFTSLRQVSSMILCERHVQPKSRRIPTDAAESFLPSLATT